MSITEKHVDALRAKGSLLRHAWLAVPGRINVERAECDRIIRLKPRRCRAKRARRGDNVGDAIGDNASVRSLSAPNVRADVLAPDLTGRRVQANESQLPRVSNARRVAALVGPV